MFSRAGRGTSDSASGLGGYFTDTATRALAPTLASMYQQNQGLQANAASMAPGLIADPALQTYLQQIGGLAGLGQQGTSTQTSTPSALQTIAGLGMGAAGLFSAPAGGTSAAAGIAALLSDIHVKTDIERIGDDPRGWGVYSWRYVWDPPEARHEGYMAHEVALIEPGAVGLSPDGWLTVDYGAL
jgi:hypothetical protein